MECQCITQYRDNGGTIIQCSWILVPGKPDDPDPATMVTVNGGLSIAWENVAKNNGALFHPWPYAGMYYVLLE